MKAGGIGGAEIQPVYALELDDPAKGFRNLPYLSKDFLDMVGFAAQTAHDLGLRLSMTLGSGWPYGGSYVPVSRCRGPTAHRCRRRRTRAPVPFPSLRFATEKSCWRHFSPPERRASYDADHAQQLERPAGDRLTLPAASAARTSCSSSSPAAPGSR